MDDTRNQKVQLGSFVLLASVLLGAMILFFGGGFRLLQSSRNYTIVFDEAPGILVGTPVRRSGVVIGTVTGVDLDDNTGKVKVSISLNSKYTIKTNEEPTVAQDIFSRDTTIDFIPIAGRATIISSVDAASESKGSTGEIPKLQPPVLINPKDSDPKFNKEEKLPDAKEKQGAIRRTSFLDESIILAQAPAEKGPGPAAPPPPPEPVPPGTVIRGRQSGDTRVLIDQASALLPTVQKTLESIKVAIERFGQVAPLLEQGAKEFTELGRSIRETVPEIRRTNDEIRSLVTGVRATTPDLKRTNDELQVAITNFAGLGEQLNVLLRVNQPKFEATIDSANKAAKDASVAIQRITDVLSEENVRNATATLRAVQSASTQLDGVIRDADILLKETTRTVSQFSNTLARTDTAISNITTATKPLAERSERILRNLDTSFDLVNRVLTSAGEVLAPLGRAEGTISKLLTDPSLYNNINATVLMTGKLLYKMDFILKDVETFADKIARHPESLGVGGAVRPSAGLKDAPIAPQQPVPYRRP